MQSLQQKHSHLKDLLPRCAVDVTLGERAGSLPGMTLTKRVLVSQRDGQRAQHRPPKTLKKGAPFSARIPRNEVRRECVIAGQFQ